MNRLLLHSIGWVTYFVIVVFYKTNTLGFAIAFQHTLLAGSINVLLFYAYAHLIINKYLVSKKYIHFTIASLGIFAVFLSFKLFIEIPTFPEFYDLLEKNSLIKERRVASGALLIVMFLSATFTRLENRIKKEKVAQQIINTQNEAQLLYLKEQINPHFLFNSLNNIYSLAVVKSDQTSAMILKLSDLLRYSIYESQKEKVLIKKEAEQIEKYIDLFQMTREEPADIVFDIQGTLEEVRIEPMILIPLVENCVKHGDFNSNPFAQIRLRLETQKNCLSFKTINTKNDYNQQKDKEGGVGLENIRKRLVLKYPDTHSFDIKETSDLFEVSLTIRNSN